MRRAILRRVAATAAVLALGAFLGGCFGGDSDYARYPAGGGPSYYDQTLSRHSVPESKSTYADRMRTYEKGLMDTDGQSDYVSRKPVKPVPAESPALAPETANREEARAKWDNPWWVGQNGAERVLASRASYGEGGEGGEVVEGGELPEYVIRTGDTLDISLAMEEGSGMSVQVRPDGRITYLFGIEVVAAGKTYRQLHDVLAKELTQYYKNPRVTVIGRTFSGNSIFIMGATTRSGNYTIRENTRLLDILAQAGVMGSVLASTSTTTYEADNPSVSIRNNSVDLDASYIARNDRILPVNFKRLLLERDMSQNILLRPRDFIFVPSIYMQGGKKVYYAGEVEEQEVISFNGKLTLRDVLLGNPMKKQTARMKGIYIVRKGVEEPIRINAWDVIQGKEPDIELMDNDIIYVPQRTLSRRSSDIKSVIDEIISPMNSVLDMHGKAYEYYNKQWQMNPRDKAREYGSSKDDRGLGQYSQPY